MDLTTIELNQIANEQGFDYEKLEKVYRLMDVLAFMNSHPLMKKRLALKGGTAIHLTIFHLPRLSEDLDFDYSVDVDEEDMVKERKVITRDLQTYMHTQGYELSETSKGGHNVDGSIYTYTNTAGVKDGITIRIHYSMRIHIYPVMHRNITCTGMLGEATVLTVSGIETFADRIRTLLAGATARDLYDVNHMIQYRLFDVSESERLKKCTLFYMAVGNDEIPESIDVGKIDEITFDTFHTELLPVMRKAEEFDFIQVKETVKSYIMDLLQLTEWEKQFLSCFRKGQNYPELLFEDVITIENLKKHPMAIWRMENRKARKLHPNA